MTTVKISDCKASVAISNNKTQILPIPTLSSNSSSDFLTKMAAAGYSGSESALYTALAQEIQANDQNIQEGPGIDITAGDTVEVDIGGLPKAP